LIRCALRAVLLSFQRHLISTRVPYTTLFRSNDGAACTLVMSEEKAKELGLRIMAYIDGFGTSGVDPSIMGIGPVGAVKSMIKKVDRKSTRLNSSHVSLSYAVFCLHKKIRRVG